MTRDLPHFETVSVEFKSAGRSGSEFILNSSRRDNVTPAEFRVMEAVHGRGNVRITSEQIGMAKEPDGFVEKNKRSVQKFRPRSNDEEVDRLRAWYGINAFGSVYPGKANEYPHLPYTFADARIPTSTPDNVRSLRTGDDRETGLNKINNALDGGEAGDEASGKG